MKRKDRVVRRISGSVLIVALVSLALMMVLLLALLQGSSHESLGAQSEAALAREKMLADTAVALVIGQVQEASTQTGQAWISQPGLLRTYDATATRKPTACYKLYSATQMIDTSGTLDFLATDAPADWNSAANQSFYTDLNAPAQPPGLFSSAIYPILDPAAITSVEGVSTDAGHAVEMPVAWLYQLQDGSLGPAAKGTKSNPIVARIAFWADDDTCKININTAGCGSGWNVPHANSTADAAWKANPPAAGEYSSYPGHPATTSLAGVFKSLTPGQLLGLTPRYAWGGSQLATQPTAPGQTVPPKTDRLYTSLDELCFSASVDSSGQRQPGAVTASQVETVRFVLTANSRAPETTLLGEPRVAIWPVSDTPQDSTRTTAADRAIASAATVGTRDYFFQRHDPLNATDDFDPTDSSPPAASNVKLFNELIKRGGVSLPGYGTTFSQKYPGANWTQLVLEMTDFIHGLNAVDPRPAPFAAFAAGDPSTQLGRGFVVPLTVKYADTTGSATLRGMGRCPTLSSLTLVFYVCGFEFNNNPKDVIDYDATPDDAAGTSWNSLFNPASPTNRWKEVTHELVRSFVVPCTFQPGCGYPEVSDACDVEIAGLDNMGSGVTNPNASFFTSPLLGNPLKVLSPDRAWGGNEGPVTWRATGDALASGDAVTYPFAGSQEILVSLSPAPQVVSAKQVTWPPSMPTIAFTATTHLTVRIRDRNGHILQTLQVDLPPFSAPAPTILGECDHRDGATPDTSTPNWATNPATHVAPSYYMSLRNRLLATQRSRPMMIQAGDISRSVEAATDLRVIAGLSSVPATFFQPHPYYAPTPINGAPPPKPITNLQGGTHAHDLRFADGTSACFSSATPVILPPPSSPIPPLVTRLVSTASYPAATASMTTVDWHDSTTPAIYAWATSPRCSMATGGNSVTMAAPGQPASSSTLAGDWDTGPGLEPDDAQINLPDSGTALAPDAAYFSLTGGQVGAATQRTPNALVSSPVIFGSLPAGINPLQPGQSQAWRTLLFCPYPAANNLNAPYGVHPGSVSPPDYLILDNFWMPTVEPYAISGCMATAGKINLNDQIAPFTWLHRSTALRALLNDLRIPAIGVSMAGIYKTPPAQTTAVIWNPIQTSTDKTALDSTIEQIENRFTNGSADAYLSESEICSVPLVPLGHASTSVSGTQAALRTFWNGPTAAGRLTGDNLRELPYAQLYGRLTTRSNSYTVHVRVQVLQKLTNDPQQNVWNENTDRILGDWRGSYQIERYLDPAAEAPAQPGEMLKSYKFRIVSSQRFTP